MRENHLTVAFSQSSAGNTKMTVKLLFSEQQVLLVDHTQLLPQKRPSRQLDFEASPQPPSLQLQQLLRSRYRINSVLEVFRYSYPSRGGVPASRSHVSAERSLYFSTRVEIDTCGGM